MNEKVSDVLSKLKAEVRELYGERLKALVLYGSWAKGDATEDSDIDMVVVLEGSVSPGREIERMIEAITDILLEHNELISVYPVSEEDYENVNSPLLMNARREGIPA
ncbi:MAG: nucleotidyltransferase domain-containing protein [Thermoplasmata archaeon]